MSKLNSEILQKATHCNDVKRVTEAILLLLDGLVDTGTVQLGQYGNKRERFT